MEAVAELESKVEEKKKRALELKIAEKAITIAEILGKKFEGSDDWPGGGLAGDSGISHYAGYEYKKGDLFIKFKNESYASGTRIIEVCFKGEQVYDHLEKGITLPKKNTWIDIFRNEDMWLGQFNELYLEALKIKEKDSQKEAKQRAGYLTENFGLK